jgi:hypothetical protein
MEPDRTTIRLHYGVLALALARALAMLACLLAPAPLLAQTHKVAAPENVVRAVGIYEWTGDMAKPTASRLIPIRLR